MIISRFLKKDDKIQLSSNNLPQILQGLLIESSQRGLGGCLNETTVTVWVISLTKQLSHRYR